MKYKVVSLVGARPQFIKEAVLTKLFPKAEIKEVLVNSGQHYDYDMAEVFFKVLGIKKPDYNLGVGSASHGEMTGKILIEFEKILQNEKPALVVVYGDTNTTLAGAIAASKLKIPVAHVEAGVRMLPKDMPEEINRSLTDRVSDLLFCCTKHNVANLKKENITKGVHFTGDVMYDLYVKMSKKFTHGLLATHKVRSKFYLATIHRDYNVDFKSNLSEILSSLNKISADTPVVIPLHPRTKNNIKKFKLEKLTSNLVLLPPVDYLEMMGLLAKSSGVITDSGGLQREAYFAQKPAFLLMPDPAWPELVEAKQNFMCTPANLSQKIEQFSRFKYRRGILGNGKAGEKIIKIIGEYLGNQKPRRG